MAHKLACFQVKLTAHQNVAFQVLLLPQKLRFGIHGQGQGCHRKKMANQSMTEVTAVAFKTVSCFISVQFFILLSPLLFLISQKAY